MDNSLDPNAETIIYDIAGDVVELDDTIEIPERWEDLSESEYAALLDQIGIPTDEIDEIFEVGDQHKKKDREGGREGEKERDR